MPPFYSERLHVPSTGLESRQREDCRPAGRLRSFSRSLAVDEFFARKHADGTVRFESLK